MIVEDCALAPAVKIMNALTIAGPQIHGPMSARIGKQVLTTCMSFRIVLSSCLGVDGRPLMRTITVGRSQRDESDDRNERDRRSPSVFLALFP